MKNYDFIGNYHDGRAKVVLNSKFGFIDENGNEICKIKYDWVADFSEGFARVKLNKKCGLINKEGKEICKVKNDWYFYYGYEAKDAEFLIDGKYVRRNQE